MTHICVGNLTIIGPDNGLSPELRQALIWTNAGILLIGPLGTKFIEILIWIQTFSFKKMHLKMSSAKWRPFCLSLNVLNSIAVQKWVITSHIKLWLWLLFHALILIYDNKGCPILSIFLCLLILSKLPFLTRLYYPEWLVRSLILSWY